MYEERKDPYDVDDFKTEIYNNNLGIHMYTVQCTW